MDNLLDTFGAPLAGMALGILLLVSLHWWRGYRAAAWARTQRAGLLAVEDWPTSTRRWTTCSAGRTQAGEPAARLEFAG